MEIFKFKELESTQLKAKELSEESQAPFIVLAESQEKGKGTKGRSWHSPFGGLYFTLAVELDFNLLEIDITKFSQESCLLVVELLKDILRESFQNSKQDDLHVKPINDLYFKDAKLAGVLLESINKTKNSILFVGIGLNVKKIDSGEIDREIISLEEILTKEDFEAYDRSEFSKKLATKLSEKLSMMQKIAFS